MPSAHGNKENGVSDTCTKIPVLGHTTGTELAGRAGAKQQVMSVEQQGGVLEFNLRNHVTRTEKFARQASTDEFLLAVAASAALMPSAAGEGNFSRTDALDVKLALGDVKTKDKQDKDFSNCIAQH